MDRTTLARKLREALFDHIEAGRRDALQDSAIDSLFERVLASCETVQVPAGAALSSCAPVIEWYGGETKPVRWFTGIGFVYLDDQGSFTRPAPADATLSSGDWGVAVGDVNLETMSVYVHKDGKFQWVSIHEPDFAKALADARTIFVS